MDLPILYQDTDLFVFNKPFGLIVNRADTVKTETVQDLVEKIHDFRSIEPADEPFLLRSGVVHRLDKETSGCLIVAKNPATFYALQALFKERHVKKQYCALVHGRIPSRDGEITAPIGRLPWNKERFGVVPQGKESHTRYEVDYFAHDAEGEQYTFVRLFPTTGRTHQLRVHLKYLGFPIVGDYLYAGRKQQLHDREWCPRVFLHAQKIAFPHPVTQEMIDVSAPLPEDLVSILDSLIKE